MYVAALSADVRVPAATSRKDKRSVVRSLVAELGHLGAAVAETGHLDLRQRAEVSAAVVAGTAAHARQVLDSLERVVHSRPELEVVVVDRRLWKGSDDGDAVAGTGDGQYPVGQLLDHGQQRVQQSYDRRSGGPAAATGRLEDPDD